MVNTKKLLEGNLCIFIIFLKVFYILRNHTFLLNYFVNARYLILSQFSKKKRSVTRVTYTANNIRRYHASFVLSRYNFV